MVGEKLMKLRKKRGMSQQEVASALGVTRQTVSNWECDQGAPSLDKAADLARLYGVSLDDLVADEVEVVVADPDQAAGKPRDLHVLRHLEGSPIRSLHLLPLMIVAGDHAKNDMAGDDPDSWKEQFRSAGYQVTCHLKGLGEFPQIRKIFLRHLEAIL